MPDMEMVYSKDIKDAANLMADDLVVVCVFDVIFYSIAGKGLLLTLSFFFFFQIHGTDRRRQEQCA